MENLDLLPADTVRALSRRESRRPSEPPAPAGATLKANLQAIIAMSMHGAGAAVKKAASRGSRASETLFEVCLTPKTAAAVNSGVAKFMPSAKGGHYADVLGANGRIAEKGVLRRVDGKALSAGPKSALPALAFNAVSLAVGQAHMAAISKQLSAISTAVDGIRRQMDLVRDGWLISTAKQLHTHLDLATRGALSIRDQQAVIDDLRRIENELGIHEHVFDQSRSDALDHLRELSLPNFTRPRHCAALSRAWREVVSWDQLDDALLAIRVLSMQTTLALDVFDPYSASRCEAMVAQSEKVTASGAAVLLQRLNKWTPLFWSGFDFEAFKPLIWKDAKDYHFERSADRETVAQMIDALQISLAQRAAAEARPPRVLVSVDANGVVGEVWWNPESVDAGRPAKRPEIIGEATPIDQDGGLCDGRTEKPARRARAARAKDPLKENRVSRPAA